jgi:hypothetical protein
MKLTRTRANEIPPEDITMGIEEHAEQSSTEPEPETSAAAEPENQDAGYTETSWANYTNYQCTLCPYSTLSREAIEEHVAWHRATRQVNDWRPTS